MRLPLVPFFRSGTPFNDSIHSVSCGQTLAALARWIPRAFVLVCVEWANVCLRLEKKRGTRMRLRALRTSCCSKLIVCAVRNNNASNHAHTCSTCGGVWWWWCAAPCVGRGGAALFLVPSNQRGGSPSWPRPPFNKIALRRVQATPSTPTMHTFTSHHSYTTRTGTRRTRQP